MFHQPMMMPTPGDYILNLLKQDQQLQRLQLLQRKQQALLELEQAFNEVKFKIASQYTGISSFFFQQFLQESFQRYHQVYLEKMIALDNYFNIEAVNLENFLLKPAVIAAQCKQLILHHQEEISRLNQIYPDRSVDLPASPAPETRMPDESTKVIRKKENKIWVLTGTSDAVNPKEYEGRESEIEHVPVATAKFRQKVWVHKESGKIINPDDFRHEQEKIEQVSRSTARSRTQIYVKKGTNIRVNPDDYVNNMNEIEKIHFSAFSSRKIVFVDKETQEIVDPEKVDSNRTEKVKIGTAYSRKKVWVKNGSGEIVNREDYENENEIEQISIGAAKLRRYNHELVWVKRGTGIIVNREDYPNEDGIEQIRRSAANTRRHSRELVWVKKDTGIIVNRDDFENEDDIEQINKNAAYRKRKRQREEDRYPALLEEARKKARFTSVSEYPGLFTKVARRGQELDESKNRDTNSTTLGSV